MLVEVSCELYTFAGRYGDDTIERRAHLGMECFNKETLGKCASYLLLIFASAEEYLLRGGRFSRYQKELAGKGVKKRVDYNKIAQEVEWIHNNLEGDWSIRMPDQTLDLTSRSPFIDTVWCFADDDEAFRFILYR